DVSVLLLEAGGKDNWIWIHIPVGYLYTQNNPRTDWCLRTEPEPGLHGRALAYPRGKVLGGCSSINGMIYMRGQARDYDQWRQAGNRGWGWDDVLPYFKKSEDYVHGADEVHGAGGEWRGEEQRPSWESPGGVREGAAEVGHPKQDGCHRGGHEGRGGARRGRRGAGRGAAPVRGAPRRVPRGGGRVRHPQDGGLQSRQEQGLRHLPHQPAAGGGVGGAKALPPPASAPPQPRGGDR